MLNDINDTSYCREVKIGKTLYMVNSVFTGEKELGSTLEKLAVRYVLDEMDKKYRKPLTKQPNQANIEVEGHIAHTALAAHYGR